MFLSREIDIKLCQNYTKTYKTYIYYIYQILFQSCSIKQIIFNKYTTNLKTTISYRSLRISDLPLLWFIYFYFAFITVIIDNILIRIVCIVRITSPELPPMAVQYTGHVYQVTTILHCYWRKFWWRNSRLYRKLSIISINNAK